jgi:hypothetical protein
MFRRPPEGYGRFAAAVLTIALVLMVPWLLMWDWIAGFNLVPDVFTDMSQTFSLVGVCLFGADLYMRKWYFPREVGESLE